MATLGAITLPVRLLVGDSDPIDLGTVEVQASVVDGRVVIDAGVMDGELADLLELSARALREGDNDASVTG